MVEPYDPFRVDENVTTPLTDVAFRFLGPMPAHELLEVGPPCGWSPNVPKGRLEHFVRLIHISGGIDKERPREAGILNIGSCEKSGFKGYDHYLDISSIATLA